MNDALKREQIKDLAAMIVANPNGPVSDHLRAALDALDGADSLSIAGASHKSYPVHGPEIGHETPYEVIEQDGRWTLYNTRTGLYEPGSWALAANAVRHAEKLLEKETKLLWQTTFVVWTREFPSQKTMAEIATDVDDKTALCSSRVTKPIKDKKMFPTSFLIGGH